MPNIKPLIDFSWAPLLLLAAAAGCLEPTAAPAKEGVPIGVLLPYTGALATAGQNLERAVMLANERLAAEEPDHNQPPFRLIFRDTHSAGGPGLDAVADMVDNEKALFILGPEEPDLAESMIGLLHDRTLAITGGAVTSEGQPGAKAWFRIVPTARQMSIKLVDRLKKDSVRSLSIIYVQGHYGNSLATLAAEEFKARGGEIKMMAILGIQPVGELVREVVKTTSDAILLIAYPTVGAEVIQEWALLGSRERWYFGPSLRSENFALNVPPGLIDGMLGVSAGLPADAPNFAKVFKQRWRGEEPTPNAHYYFDAMVLAGLSYRLAVVKTGSPNPTPADLASALVSVSGPGGVNRTWQEVGQALTEVEKGMDIDYRGASGAIDFSPDGFVPAGSVEGWTIKNGVIEYRPLMDIPGR
jgi:neutral amino acid transport system substrate-binding protein